jgi:DNA adenine methylase
LEKISTTQISGLRSLSEQAIIKKYSVYIGINMQSGVINLPRIKSPLRYPGGKSRALKQILPIIHPFKEYREPMVGGGSVFFALKQFYPNKNFWINDINQELYFFWKNCKENNNLLVSNLRKTKNRHNNGELLYSKVQSDKHIKNDIKRAVRFFILNRITFSGLSESGGYSDESFKKRFTDSSVDRLILASKVLKNTQITNRDYTEVIKKEGEDVFIFLDPPYFSTVKQKLYGKNGDLHEVFDHKKFAREMEECNHKWLITYDDCPEIRELFSFTPFIYQWQLQYGMNNFKQNSSAKGNELFISNYRIPCLEPQRIKQ